LRPRNSGNYVLDHNERKCKFQIFWKCCSVLFLIIQKFCGGPEILDQFFRPYQNAVHAPEIQGTVLRIIATECARSTNPGHFVLDHNERKCKFQIFWKCCSVLFLIIQKFCCGPEILDQFFRPYRNAVRAPEIQGTVLRIIATECARSRNLGNFVLDHNERKCKSSQKFWKCCSV
jgi:hypothetical protein